MAMTSGLRAGRPLPPGRLLVLISVKSLSQLQGHSAAGWIRKIEKCNDISRNEKLSVQRSSRMQDVNPKRW
jgi:hypothetical protein